MATSKSLFDLAAKAAADYSSSQYCCCKLTAEGPPPTATLCATAGEYAWGILQDDPAAANRGCTVRMKGTSKAKAGDVVAFGAELTVDSSGRVVTRSANNQARVGFALRAATAANDIIEVYLDQLKADVVLADGVVAMPLTAARELSGTDIINIAGDCGVLGKDTTPNLEFINTGTDSQVQLEWASSNSDAIAWNVVLPADCDDASTVTFNCYAKSGGATNTPSLTLTAFEGVGDTNFGGATAALSATLALKTVIFAAADVGAGPKSWVITLTPGAHTTDTVVIQGACWLTYTRK